MSPHKRALRDHIATPQEWRQCGGKRRYPDRGQALKAGRQSLDFERDKALWIYKCPVCRGYHLTKKPGPARDACHGE